MAVAAASAETPESLYRQAVNHFSGQRFDAAESLLRDAVKQRPRWFEARFLLGASLVSLGRAAEAVEQLEAARRLNPAHLDCAKLLAAEYLGLDKPTEALAALRPLLTATRSDEELLLLAIEALEVRGNA
ncbi:MAG: CDC27 family protein, partial [Bryobacteraceae bacterium]